jgi:hypothetical protein
VLFVASDVLLNEEIECGGFNSFKVDTVIIGIVVVVGIDVDVDVVVAVAVAVAAVVIGDVDTVVIGTVVAVVVEVLNGSAVVIDSESPVETVECANDDEKFESEDEEREEEEEEEDNVAEVRGDSDNA